MDVLLVVVNLVTTALFLYSFTGRNYYFSVLTKQIASDADASRGESVQEEEKEPNDASDIEVSSKERGRDNKEQISHEMIQIDRIPSPKRR